MLWYQVYLSENVHMDILRKNVQQLNVKEWQGIVGNWRIYNFFLFIIISTCLKFIDCMHLVFVHSVSNWSIIKCTQLKQNRGACFWIVCHTLQNNTAHPGVLPIKPLFFTVEVYKRTSMGSRSFSDHKHKCPNRGKNQVKTVHQGGFLS